MKNASHRSILLAFAFSCCSCLLLIVVAMKTTDQLAAQLRQDPPLSANSVCGNGKKEGYEICDDGNTDNGDGCKANCQEIEHGWTCSQVPYQHVTEVSPLAAQMYTPYGLHWCRDRAIQLSFVSPTGKYIGFVANPGQGRFGYSAYKLYIADGATGKIIHTIENVYSSRVKLLPDGRVRYRQIVQMPGGGFSSEDHFYHLGPDEARTERSIPDIGNFCGADIRTVVHSYDVTKDGHTVLFSGFIDFNDVANKAPHERLGLYDTQTSTVVTLNNTVPLKGVPKGAYMSENADIIAMNLYVHSNYLYLLNFNEKKALELCSTGIRKIEWKVKDPVAVEQCQPPPPKPDPNLNTITRCTPVCGDNLVVGNEQCDDGNMRGGDGCDVFCQREVLPEICTDSEDNDEDGKVDCEDEDCMYHGHCRSPKFCCTNNACDQCTWFEGRGFYSGRYESMEMCEQECGGGTPLSNPVCGNGTTEGNEQCDDGNTESSDGCSANCQRETQCPNGTYVTSGNPCPEIPRNEIEVEHTCNEQNGIVTFDNQTLEDMCVFNYILDFHCRDSHSLGTNMRECEGGCRNGECTDNPSDSHIPLPILQNVRPAPPVQPQPIPPSEPSPLPQILPPAPAPIVPQPPVQPPSVQRDPPEPVFEQPPSHAAPEPLPQIHVNPPAPALIQPESEPMPMPPVQNAAPPSLPDVQPRTYNMPFPPPPRNAPTVQLSDVYPTIIRSDGGSCRELENGIVIFKPTPHTEQRHMYNNCSPGGNALIQNRCWGNNLARSQIECPNGCRNDLCR